MPIIIKFPFIHIFVRRYLDVPTDRGLNFKANEINDEISKIQVIELDKNCNKFGIRQFDITSP